MSIRSQIVQKLGPDKAKLWIAQIAQQIAKKAPLDESALPDIPWSSVVTSWIYLSPPKTLMWSDGPHPMRYGQIVYVRDFAEAIRDAGFRIQPYAAEQIGTTNVPGTNEIPKRRGRPPKTA